MADCTGDPGAISYTDGSVTSVIVENLTKDIEASTAIELTDTGSSDGADGAELWVTGEFKDHTVVATTTGIKVQSEGHVGSGGTNHEPFTGAAYGGSGGTGGSGGLAIIQLEDSAGLQSSGTGVVAYSIGADGGEGGYAYSGIGLYNVHGGTGGTGGEGGEVEIEFQLGQAITVENSDDKSYGIYASSRGGDGGAGGLTDTASGNDYAGSGGAGGDGGTVDIDGFTVTNTITTIGESSHGVLAQSLGGAGADGQDGISTAGSSNGGDGGTGGAGGTVTVSLDADIMTSGDKSQGIILQSYGGAGGNGGSGNSFATSGSGGASRGGGPGGEMSITFTGTITTAGDEADGILTQSIGGFSGNAGDASGLVTYGASTQSGGAGGAVTVKVDSGSAITTTGTTSSAIEAQSIGGGGGKGSSSSSAFTAMGGDGDAGGDGGAVTIEVTKSTLTTSGLGSAAITALSVGGGGGSGGSVSSIVTQGGSGGTGGDGGDVKVTLDTVELSTSSLFSEALYASSIGGGGGNAARSTSGIVSHGGSGGDGGAGGTVEVTISGSGGSASTSADNADGILLQSVGGGGGKGSSVVTIDAIGQYSEGYGGSGGKGGSGGDVTYTDEGATAISTTGYNSAGITAHSIGGGGGRGGDEVTVTAGAIVSVALGMSGGGGNGSDGGDVSVTAGGPVTTQGYMAPGIYVQSLGGGGGSSGNVVAASTGLDAVNFEQATGGSGGEAGSGGQVTVASTGEIMTMGLLSDAIFAQSTGGGGGAAGAVYSGSGLSALSVSQSLGQDGGKGGNGETVEVTTSGDIFTSGAIAYGIFAQSLGGGGGKTGASGAFDALSGASFGMTVGGSAGSGGDGGAVTVSTNNNISTSGDYSAAIAAQSIGGNGGSSAMSFTGTGGSAAGVSVAVGGSGGASGNAEDVTVDANGTISTSGELAYGILAQSVAGSGGNGGTVVSVDALELDSTSVSLSGTGGSGESAGKVTVTSAGGITTEGSNAIAILAQSLGGGGGSGGSSFSGSLSMAAVSVSLGGDGGDGGTGGEVEVTNSAALETGGVYAHGISAQSQGGSGGNGGSVMNIAATAGEVSGAVEVSLGGGGGSGGVSDSVTVNNENTITVSGFAANAILAQAIGGSGGAGGSVVSGETSVTEAGTLGVTIGVGGDGGDGGLGGDVSATNSANLTVNGDMASAIFAQSIGGNGGYGGGSYAYIVNVSQGNAIPLEVTVGGDGGSGSTAGDVTIENTGDILITGGGGDAVSAQSIGGNGGAGGMAANVFANFISTSTSSYQVKANVAVGGTGGSGQDAGDVSVTSSGSITTEQDVSRAIFAQSIGGGGGAGGSAGSFTIGYLQKSEDASADSFSFNLALGGSGGAAGDGKTVTVANEDIINTSGIASYGIYAQSVGGGGGNGGDGGAVALNGWVADVAEIGGVVTEAQVLQASLDNPQLFYKNVSFDVGGSGGASGNGNKVTVTNTSAITTTGGDATAIFAQSVGGGGGSGGDGSQGLGTGFTVGGKGSGGGDGGEVEVTLGSGGTVTTTGDRAMGIFAQSVGGGGGMAGDVEISTLLGLQEMTIGANAVFSETSGAGGDGGAITVTTSAAITTSGSTAHGIWAQSVGGGGGGEGQLSTDTGYDAAAIGSAGDDGNGGDVEITTGDAITLTGDYSLGIMAESVSGGTSGYSSGDVTIDVGADIASSGAYGRAILAQSQADEVDSQGAIAITVENGATVSTSADGYDTISLLDGNANTITNYGTIAKDEGSSVNNYVITNLRGSLTIDNEGLLSGSISLDDDYVQQLTNASDGTVELGLEFDLGTYDDSTQSEFSNSGIVSAGAVGAIQTSAVTVPLFDSEGTLWVDLSLGTGADDGSTDLINLTGEAALNGELQPNMIGTNLVTSGETGTVTVLTADSVSEDLTVVNSSTVEYDVSVSGGTDVQLTYAVDYSGVGDAPLPATARNFAAYFDEVVGVVRDEYAEGSDERENLSNLANLFLNTKTTGELAALYLEHVLDEAGISVQAARRSTLDLHNLLHSCPNLNHASLDDFLHQRECEWFSAGGYTLHRDQTDDNAGYDENQVVFSAGIQREATDNLFVEIAGNFDLYRLFGDNFEQKGYRADAGAVVKKEIGNYTLSATLSGGIFGYDFTRNYETLNGTQSASSNPFGGFVGGELRASAIFNRDRFYAKPSLALTAMQIWQQSFSEQGSGGLDWQMSGVSESYFAIRPRVEFGRSFVLNERPAVAYLRTGLTAFLNDPNTDMSAQFTGLGDTLPDFDLSLESDRYYGDLELGMETELGPGTTLSLIGQGSLSEHSWAVGGSVLLRHRF